MFNIIVVHKKHISPQTSRDPSQLEALGKYPSNITLQFTRQLCMKINLRTVKKQGHPLAKRFGKLEVTHKK